jgi:O-acetylserine/cysteine efflux transporter
VAPLSLLVPVVGLASAALLLDETLSALQLLGAVLIMAGLYINVFGLRLRRATRVKKRHKKAPRLRGKTNQRPC